jgi:predicted Zn-dependent protease
MKSFRISERMALALFVMSLMTSGLSCTTIGGATIGPTLQKLSLEMAKELAESGALLNDPALTAYVSAVGDRLVTQADSKLTVDFSFAVLDQPEPNAFAIPSGHIYVSRGLLTLLNTEDELAGVLGHEIGHVTRQHSLKQATGSLAIAPIRVVTRLGGAIVGLVLPPAGNAITATVEVPAALTGASYGRSQENEADKVGQTMAAAGGWDPMALSRVMDAFAREAAIQGQDPTASSWFSTHPTSPKRAEQIRERASDLPVGPPQPIAKTPVAFLSKLDGLVVGASARDGVFNGAEFLHPGLAFVMRFPAGEEWTQINTEQAVAAVRKEPPALVVLEVVANGDNALAVAQAFKPNEGKLDAPPTSETVNGLATAYATGRVKGGWGREPLRGSARWIAHQDFVYRILSESTEEHYEDAAHDFDSAERSFRVLESADRARILEDRLHIETAMEGETLEQLLVRVGSKWNLEEAAAANGVDSNVAFGRGELVKVTRRERYRADD